MTAPLSSNGLNVYFSGTNLVFSTYFGLTVYWNGNSKFDVSLCDAYAGYTCGLCGNSDGIILIFSS